MSQLNTDLEGFLRDLSAWNKDIAHKLAQNENLVLTPEHWQIITVIREFYQEYHLHPGMRILIKVLQQKIGNDHTKIDSIYIHLRFPQGIKQLSKISGLPKPINCI